MVNIAQIQEGFKFLLRRCQNLDGGICADEEGDESSPLTTGECLAACASSPFLPVSYADNIYKMAGYLVRTQSVGEGCWHAEGDVDILSTAFAITGLCNARTAVKAMPELNSDAENAIARGVAWLSEKHNSGTGGWSVRQRDASSGRYESNTTVTCYCLEVYHLLGTGYADSEPAIRGREFLMRIRNANDGGWGFAAGQPSDVGSTARVLDVLARSGFYPSDSLPIREAITYLLRHRTGRPVWDIELERFGLATDFYANTPADATKALLRAGYRGRVVTESIDWFARTQNVHDGHWILRDTKREHMHSDITTWSTRDAVDTLGVAAQSLPSGLQSRRKRHRAWQVLALLFMIISVVEAFVLLGLGRAVTNWWNNLSSTERTDIYNWVFVVILLGIAIGVIGNLISAGILARLPSREK